MPEAAPVQAPTAPCPAVSPFRELLIVGAVLVGNCLCLLLAAKLAGRGWGEPRWLAPLWMLMVTGGWLAAHPVALVPLSSRSCRPWVWPVVVTAISAPIIVRTPALQIIFLAPLAEELFFRGLLLDHLRRQLGRVAAVVLVSALFGFLHYPQGTAVLMAFGSVGLCLVVLWLRQVVWAMVLHVAWNLLVVACRERSLLDPLALVAAGTLLAVLATYGYLTRKAARHG
jgi:membrane protease YdiL (CAAX protease family)